MKIKIQPFKPHHIGEKGSRHSESDGYSKKSQPLSDKCPLAEGDGMKRLDFASRLLCIACVIACSQVVRFNQPPATGLYASEPQETEVKSEETTRSESRNESIRGQVVWLADALKKEFDISTVSEVAENSLALLTEDGQLLPIVEDLRGRAFRKDERLRGCGVELLVRRHERHPLIQILRVYEIEDGNRSEVDYWCDVCAIVMFEKGPCACCQDENRLRKRLVKDDP